MESAQYCIVLCHIRVAYSLCLIELGPPTSKPPRDIQNSRLGSDSSLWFCGSSRPRAAS